MCGALGVPETSALKRFKARQPIVSEHHDDFGGLHRDLLSTGVAIDRRRMLRLAAGFGAVGLSTLHLGGCESGTDNGDPTSSCARIPEETAGPFPGEGSIGPNVLNVAGVVRQDIRSSFGGLVGTADGILLDLELTLVSASECAPLAGGAVYLWQCDRLGRYSLYNAGVTNQNYLRGVQAADASGKVMFRTIFPGCYPGRWPHLHFEVFRTLAAASNVANKVATSQLAFPAASCTQAYATPGYEGSRTALANVSLAGDSVFRDGSARQLATVTGSVATGFTAALPVAVAL
jgi:protocatechuate 3,4-dioxygenase beta subunit